MLILSPASRKDPPIRTRGFTILEVLVVISVVAILIGVSIPRIQGIQTEAKIIKAKRELKTLQAAVESYRSNHSNTNPIDISAALISAFPQMITSALTDPFSASDYQYTTTGSYYAISSVGPNKIGQTTSPLATGNVSVAGDDLATSNGTITIAGSIADAASCAQNADCDSGACGGASPVCRPTGLVAINGDCGNNADCQSGYCDPTSGGKCTSGSIGSTCANGSQCQTGYCDSLYSGACTDGSIGSKCVANSECASGYCDSWFAAECASGETGSPCIGDSECKPELHCDTVNAHACVPD